MADRVIQRNDTAARWQSINPVLATGEIGIEIDGAKGYKIGDGKTRWNDLSYPANPTSVVQDLGNNENAVPSQKLVTEKLSELGQKVFTGEYEEKSINDVIIPGIYIKKVGGDAYHRDILFVSKISSSNNLIQTRIIVDSSNSFRIETRKYIDGIWGSWTDYLTPRLFTNGYIDEDLNGITSTGVYIRNVSNDAYSRDVLFVGKNGDNVVQTRLRANISYGLSIETRTYKDGVWNSWINVMREKIPSYSWSSEALGYTPVSITIKKGSNVTNKSDYKIILGSDDDLTERLDIESGETKTVTFEVRNVRIASAGLINLSILENIENSIGKEAIKDNCISTDKLRDNAVVERKTVFFKQNLFNENDEDNKYGYSLTTNGNLKESAAYMVTGYIPFDESQINLIVSVGGIQQTTAGGLICLYDKDKKYITGYTSISVGGIATWQDGVSFVRFSVKDYKLGNIQVEEGTVVGEYMPQGVSFLKDKYIRLPQIDSIRGNDAIKAEVEPLVDGDIFELAEYPYHIKKGMVLTFSANIDNFSKLCVGKGYQKYRGNWLEIDGTNIVHKFYESAEKIKSTIAHGLTIDGYIKVSMSVNDAGIMNLIVMTKGGSFRTDVNWGYEANYAAFAKSVGSTLNDIKFSGTNQDFRNSVWLFGTSYHGVAKNRIIGVLRDWGYFNYLVDALAGQDSKGAYSDLLRCLKYGTPKYLLWCMGGNDSDSLFTTYFEKVKSLCEQKGITMIAVTNTTTPTRSKEVINQYVKDSGVRYIDIYSSVGADANGNWYEGYLSGDNIHPTDLGAQAMAMQVLVDFPELMQYGTSKIDSEIGDIEGDK